MSTEPTTGGAPGAGTTHDPSQAHNADTAPETIDVYWRPGCPFCSRLFRVLDGAGVSMRRHDIWSDDDARAFVRAHDNGHETVPTVALGEVVLVNPDPFALLDALEARHRVVSDHSTDGDPMAR